MLLKLRENQHLVAVADLDALIDPYRKGLMARAQWGEEEQEPESFLKAELCFPSGEDLPRCWCDEHYRDHELVKHRL